jgi:O-antigen/teichoic acid export membrane protein
MHQLTRSIFFSGVGRYGSVLCSLLSTAVLSRLLTPTEFGISVAVIALTTVTTACSQEFGGANYLIQKHTLLQHDIRTAFSITFCISVLLGALFFELRDSIAYFYSEEGLKAGIAVFSASFLLIPFSATMSALLRRDMEFDILAWCSLAAAFITSVTSIVLAWRGCSYLGILIGSVTGQGALVVLLATFCRHRMRVFLPCVRGWRDVIGFGAYSSAVVVINVVHDAAPQLILGRILDFTAVGLYSRGASAPQLFDKILLGVFNPIIMPAISAQIRAGADLKRLYLQAVELLTAAQWPFLCFMALMAEPIVQIWFGEGWLEVVPLVRMLSLASLSLFAACLTYPALVAVGRVRDTLTSSLISLPPSLLVIFVASFFGVWAVAASAFLILPFQAAVALYFVARRLGFTWVELFRAMLRSGGVVACSCAGVLLSTAPNNFSLTVSSTGLLAAGIAGLVGWFLGLAMMEHPLLGYIRLAARDMAVTIPGNFLLRLAKAVRSART